jgi:hypothetical protein
MFTNSDPVNCPIFYWIQQSFVNNPGREWGSVRDVLTVNPKLGFVELEEELYRGEQIITQLQAITPFQQPVERQIQVKEKVVIPPKCEKQTVSVNGSGEDITIFAQRKELKKEEPTDTQKFVYSATTVQEMFSNSDEYNCPISFYLVSDWGKDLTYLLESGKSMVRIADDGRIAVDEVRYNDLTFIF